MLHQHDSITSTHWPVDKPEGRELRRVEIGEYVEHYNAGRVIRPRQGALSRISTGHYLLRRLPRHHRLLNTYEGVCMWWLNIKLQTNTTQCVDKHVINM